MVNMLQLDSLPLLVSRFFLPSPEEKKKDEGEKKKRKKMEPHLNKMCTPNINKSPRPSNYSVIMILKCFCYTLDKGKKKKKKELQKCDGCGGVSYRRRNKQH